MQVSGVRVRFLGQPYADGSDLRDFLSDVGTDVRLTSLRVATAWAKRSGLSRVSDIVTAFQSRGDSQLILGIDEGGATSQGLRLALDLFDEVYVFHDRGSRTFHPKIYVASGERHASVLIGSNNLTAGGLIANYEAGTRLDLDVGEATDEAFLGDVHRYLDTLISDTAACKPLDESLLASLLADPRYRIGDEDHRRQRAEIGDESDSVIEPDERESIFERSALPRRSVPAGPPRQTSPPRPPATRQPGAQPGVPPVPTGANPPTGGAAVVKRWQKVMTHSDAQQRRTANTQITGNLKLGQARHQGLDHRTYFRQDFFGRVAWTATPKPRGDLESAYVTFEVILNGMFQGVHTLKVDHADYRVANQANVPTWLHWDTLSPLLQGTNHVGDYVVLERLADGRFRLLIDSQSPGPSMV